MRELEIFKKPLFWLSLLFVLVCAFIFSLPDGRLHLVFCDVGQGDAILISYLQNQVLIDGGPDNKILECLSKKMPFWDRKIEMIVLTHPEKDHETGLIDVLKRYSVKYFVSNNLQKSSTSVKSGDQIKIGPLRFLVLWPPKNYGMTNELNDSSVVLKLSFGYSQALFTGDISEKIEQQIDLEEIEILKVAHHGSKFSTSKEFLSKIKPKLAIISVGENRFGHPTPEVLERLKQAGVKVLRTDQQGNIEIVSDGRGWYTKLYDKRPD